jgi:hypothetical protein
VPGGTDHRRVVTLPFGGRFPDYYTRLAKMEAEAEGKA